MSHANLQVLGPSPACHRYDPCIHLQELPSNMATLKNPYETQPTLVLKHANIEQVSPTHTTSQPGSHTHHGYCSLVLLTPPNEPVHTYADRCCHLGQPGLLQACFSRTPAGSAAQQRSANSFPTRPTPRSCTFRGVLRYLMTGLAPHLRTAQRISCVGVSTRASSSSSAWDAPSSYHSVWVPVTIPHLSIQFPAHVNPGRQKTTQVFEGPCHSHWRLSSCLLPSNCSAPVVAGISKNELTNERSVSFYNF